MYKFVVATILLAAGASAGLIGAPVAHGSYVHAAPLAVAHAPALAVAHAPIAVAHHAPAATSYANTYRVVHDSVPVVKTVAHAAPAVHVAHAPLAVAHAPLVHAAPVAVSHGALLGHGYGGLHHY